MPAGLHCWLDTEPPPPCWLPPSPATEVFTALAHGAARTGQRTLAAATRSLAPLTTSLSRYVTLAASPATRAAYAWMAVAAAALLPCRTAPPRQKVFRDSGSSGSPSCTYSPSWSVPLGK